MHEATKVLIAENDLMLRIAIRDFLQDEGFDVIEAENLSTLLERAGDASSLVVDARLPTERLEGIEGVGNLLQAGRISAETPVVFISVLAESEYLCEQKLRALSIPKGRYVWLQKRFELELLASVLRHELDKRRNACS